MKLFASTLRQSGVTPVDNGDAAGCDSRSTDTTLYSSLAAKCVVGAITIWLSNHPELALNIVNGEGTGIAAPLFNVFVTPFILHVVPVLGDVTGASLIGLGVTELFAGQSTKRFPSEKPEAITHQAHRVTVAGLPPAAKTIVQSIKSLLASVPALNAANGTMTDERFSARAMLTDYLPSTLEAYRAIPILNRRQYDDQLIAQLHDLERAATALVAGETAHAVNVLDANGAFIVERFADTSSAHGAVNASADLTKPHVRSSDGIPTPCAATPVIASTATNVRAQEERQLRSRSADKRLARAYEQLNARRRRVTPYDLAIATGITWSTAARWLRERTANNP